MPIYDYDGTTLHEIGKIYDFNGTTSQQINKVYDSTGGRKQFNIFTRGIN